MPRPHVLVIHALRPTSRQTTVDHLLSFSQHLPNADIQYLHFAQPLPREIADGVAPDLLIVNYDYLNYRFSPLWPYIKNRHRDIAHRSGKVVAIAQDDFWAHRILDDWCIAWDVDRVLTPIETDIEVLYPKTTKVADFRTVLTGYASAKVLNPLPLRDREIDLGQRVRLTPVNLGSFAQEKAVLATRMAAEFASRGYATDVSTRSEDSFIGPEWLKFLENCKFTISMKGGASIADPYGLLYLRYSRHNQLQDGHIQRKLPRKLRRRDGKFVFKTISPRVFEAAGTGTCQILRVDDYLPEMEPWLHYVPIEPNFNNLEVVFKRIADLAEMQEIVDRCKKALVDSSCYSSMSLVRHATENLLSATESHAKPSWSNLVECLRKSRQLASDISTITHDFAVNLIQNANLHRLSSRQADQLSSLRTLALDVGIDREWLQWYGNLWKSDPGVARMPWAWRPVPSSPTRS
jgi:hypothetical protein